MNVPGWLPPGWYVIATDHPAEPGDVRLEQQERDWDRDEAEQLEERYASDPGRVDA